jgi:plasmid maintenance system antidote protein VapI
VESILERSRVTFEVLRARLVKHVKRRIDNGEFTERGLSKILGISQSQTHNVLKGARRLQMPLADRILLKLGLSAMDLLNEGELDSALHLKTTEWESQPGRADADSLMETAVLELPGLLPAKKPVSRSATRRERAEPKAS